MGFVLANTGGRLHPADEPSITPLDRGFLYGDAIYEVWRTYHGVLFALGEHWERLERSAAALFFPLPFSRDQLFAEIKHTAEAFRERTGDRECELYIRLQVTRGAGEIGLDPALAEDARWVLLVQPLKMPAADLWVRGMRLSLARALRRNHPTTLDPAWKTGNYLNNLLCLREARARGADEVLITNLAGEITECAVCNFAVVRHGVVHTPRLGAGILGGITRRLLLEKVAPRAGIEARETVLHPGDLAGCEEAFILSTTRDLAPVHAVDEHTFRLGLGTVTWRLKEAFVTYAREQAGAHPELRI